MERVYDRKERVAGYFNASKVYNRHHEVVGYIHGPLLLDINHRQVAFIRDNALYSISGRPLSYFDGRVVRDFSGRRLGRVNSSSLGLLSTGLLLESIRHNTKKYSPEGHKSRLIENGGHAQDDKSYYNNQPDPRPRMGIKEYYQTGRTMVRKYGPMASYLGKYVLSEPAFGAMSKMGGYWPLVSVIGRSIVPR